MNGMIEVAANAGAETPLYRLIARTLQTEVVRGVYQVGSTMPSEAALTERFGVSRHTARAAMRDATGRRLDQNPSRARIDRPAAALEAGFRPRDQHDQRPFSLDAASRYDPISAVLVRLPRWAGFFPALARDKTWLHITGDRSKPGAKQPFNEIDAFVAARFAGVSRMIEAGSSIYSALEAIYGEMIVEVEQVIGGFTADGSRGTKIGLRPGESGIEVRRLHRIDMPSEVAIVTFNRFRTPTIRSRWCSSESPAEPALR